MEEDLRRRLEALAEPGYRAFAARLLPGLAPERLLGVRLPNLRRLAREIVRDSGAGWLSQPVSGCFEEIMLRGMVIGALPGGAEEVWPLVEAFVPLIDNWSVCDSFCAGLKLARRQPDAVWPRLLPYLADSRPYFVRFGAVMLLTYYVNSQRVQDALALLEAADCPEYYAQAAVAWALSIYYVNFPEEVTGCLRRNRLDAFTHNKAIQKIVESRQVSAEAKEAVRALRRDG